MDDTSEKRAIVNGSYQMEVSLEDLDESLARYFEQLEDKMYGVEALEMDEREYSFGAAGSQVDVLYDLEELEDNETELDIEFAGAKPLVERLYGDFEESRQKGIFSSL